MKRLTMLLALALCAPSQAALNKWVDAQGNVHYSDQPPPPNVKAATVRGAPQRIPLDGAQPAYLKPYMERAADQRRAEQVAKEENARAEQARSNADIKNQNCTVSMQNLYALESRDRLVEYDRSGAQREVSGDERERRLIEARAEVDKWCK